MKDLKHKRRTFRKTQARIKASLKGVEPPRSAYLVWCNAERSRISAKLGTTNMRRCAEEAGRMWKKMSEEDKKPYRDELHQLRASYNQFLKSEAGYQALAQKKVEVSAKRENKHRQDVKMAVKAIHKDVKIRRPQSSYFLFQKSIRPAIVQLLGGKPWAPIVTKQVSAAWKALCAEDRQFWDDKAKKQKQAYNDYRRTPASKIAVEAYITKQEETKAKMKNKRQKQKESSSMRVTLPYN